MQWYLKKNLPISKVFINLGLLSIQSLRCFHLYLKWYLTKSVSVWTHPSGSSYTSWASKDYYHTNMAPNTLNIWTELCVRKHCATNRNRGEPTKVWRICRSSISVWQEKDSIRIRCSILYRVKLLHRMKYTILKMIKNMLKSNNHLNRIHSP